MVGQIRDYSCDDRRVCGIVMREMEPYDDILKRAEVELTSEEKKKLIRELTRRSDLRDAGSAHSILELDGLGRELWKNVDADEHVEKERENWNG